MNYMNNDITVVITQRCNAKCVMCDIHDHPSRPEEEMDLSLLDKIPNSKLITITGGEPFLRKDICEVVGLLLAKSKRLIIHTNGFYTDNIVALCKEHPDVAIRVSMDGGPETHNAIRGIDIYSHAVNTLSALKDLGLKDLGVNFTLQDNNCEELLDLYHTAVRNKWDFAVNVVHNSYAFYKSDNEYLLRNRMIEELKKLVHERLGSKKIKDWGRAFIDSGSVQYLEERPMQVECDAGRTSFFIDTYGHVLPCHMTPAPWIMGDLRTNSWENIVNGDKAKRIIDQCKNCKTPCWSLCNTRTSIEQHLWMPVKWLLKNKFFGSHKES